MNKTVNYAIVEDTDTYLLIKDLGPWDEHLSLTNGAEIVVAELAARLGGRSLYYIDTEGLTDRLLVANGEFAGFRPGGPDGKRKDT